MTKEISKTKLTFFSVAPLEESGGYERFQIQTANAIDELSKNLDIEIVTFGPKLLKRYHRLLNFYYFRKLPDPLKESHQEVLSKLSNNINYIQFDSLRKLFKHLRKASLIYSKNEIVELILLRIARSKSKKIIGFATAVVYPNPDSWQSKLHNLIYSNKIYFSLVNQASVWHVKNQFDFDYLNKKNILKPITFIPNGYDFDAMAEAKNDKTYKGYFPVEKFNITWTGRLTEQKGIVDLIEIIEQASRINPNIYFHIAGDGEQKQLIIQLTEKYKNVKYYGHIEQSSIYSFIANSNLYCSTSRWETFGSSMVEALGVGIPVISFDISGPDHFIKNGNNGFLVNDNDDYIDKITKLATNQLRLKSHDIAKDVSRQLSFQTIANQFYNTLIKDKK